MKAMCTQNREAVSLNVSKLDLLCENVKSNFMHLITRSWDTSLKSLKSKLKGLLRAFMRISKV